MDTIGIAVQEQQQQTTTALSTSAAIDGTTVENTALPRLPQIVDGGAITATHTRQHSSTGLPSLDQHLLSTSLSALPRGQKGYTSATASASTLRQALPPIATDAIAVIQQRQQELIEHGALQATTSPNNDMSEDHVDRNTSSTFGKMRKIIKKDHRHGNVMPSWLDNLQPTKRLTMAGVDSMAALPSVVHFGGFQLGVTHRQTVRIVNKSDERIRLTISAPTTPEFRIHQHKKGFFVPGFHEEFDIEFTPREWRYHQDAVKIQSSAGESISIPLHGYPTMNDVLFPKKIDFGNCLMAQRVTKKIPLKCNVPIDFEFEIEMLETHPYLSVQPARGIVPGNGAALIEISFCPLTMQTCTMSFVLRVAQYGFTPFVCEVMGGCHLVPDDDRHGGKRHAHHRKKLGGISAASKSHAGSSIKSDGTAAKSSSTKENSRRPAGVVPARVVVAPASDQQDTRKTRLQEFINELDRQSDYEKYKDLHRFICVGEAAPAAAQLAQVTASRESVRLAAAVEAREKREREVQSPAPKLLFTTIIHKEERPVLDFKPTFDLYHGIDWAGMSIPLRKFRLAAQTIVYRIRQERRKQKFAKQSVDAIRETAVVKKSTDDDAFTEIESLIRDFAKNALPVVLPTFPAELVIEHKHEEKTVEPVIPARNSNFSFCDLLSVPNYRYSDYERCPLPDETRHVDVAIVKPLRYVVNDVRADGARGEDGASGKAPFSFWNMPVPAFFERELQYPPLFIYDPMPGMAQVAPLLPFDETTYDYMLNPSVKRDVISESRELSARMHEIKALSGNLDACVSSILARTERAPKTASSESIGTAPRPSPTQRRPRIAPSVANKPMPAAVKDLIGDYLPADFEERKKRAAVVEPERKLRIMEITAEFSAASTSHKIQ